MTDDQMYIIIHVSTTRCMTDFCFEITDIRGAELDYSKW